MPRFLIRYLLYPVLACATLAYLLTELSRPRQALGAHHGWFIGGVVISLVLIESLWPLRTAWRMTGRLFWRRDLPFLLLGGATIGAGNVLGGWVVLHHGMAHPGWLSGLPVWPAALLSLLITDGLWYAVHRACHEAQGPWGQWLWRVHAAHHLPSQVYVFMHAIAHPFNTLIVRLLLTVPPWLLGVPPEALFVANVVTGVQGLVSHFNVDSRVGWVNRVLVGTELHRWHHAADVRGNYAAVLSIWDQLFGSFVYRPGHDPLRLGVAEPEANPSDMALGAVLMAPIWPGIAPEPDKDFNLPYSR
jgi:sterol desaturase/sphingolipid hydroxylase (fatty acid hydroxylase superfamily)